MFEGEGNEYLDLNNLLATCCFLKDLQHLQQLQQQNLNLQQFVLVHPTTNLQPAQFIISQTPQGQQGKDFLCFGSVSY